MSYTDYELINGILNWSEEHPKFDTKFVDDVMEFYELENRITESQRAALENIVERWRINLDEYLD